MILFSPVWKFWDFVMKTKNVSWVLFDQQFNGASLNYQRFNQKTNKQATCAYVKLVH